mmetsp:Transcript_984/g.3091  ORF Transcript_984/g.3091 Transcript_984/m.3091 type:complete len:235 (+) Transcript_984:1491-2195(+)
MGRFLLLVVLIIVFIERFRMLIDSARVFIAGGVVTSTSIVIHSISPSPLPNRVLKLVILLHLHPRVYSSDRSSPEQQLHVVLGVVQRIRVSRSIVLFTPIELKLIFCPFRFLLHLLHLLGFVSHPGVLLPKLLQLFLSFSFRLLAFVSLVLSLRHVPRGRRASKSRRRRRVMMRCRHRTTIASSSFLSSFLFQPLHRQLLSFLLRQKCRLRLREFLLSFLLQQFFHRKRLLRLR